MAIGGFLRGKRCDGKNSAPAGILQRAANGAGFERELVEHGDVVGFALRNVDETGNVAAEIEERMKFDGGLAAAKVGPGKERQAQVDGGGVERVDGVVQSDAERLVGIQRPGLGDEDVSEVVIDAPVVDAVGVGQRAPRNGTAEAGVIALASGRVQAGDDVAEALAERELGEGKCEELIAAGEAAGPVMPAVASDAVVEVVPRQVVHQLGKHEVAGEHGEGSTVGTGLFRQWILTARVEIVRTEITTKSVTGMGLPSIHKGVNRTVVTSTVFSSKS